MRKELNLLRHAFLFYSRIPVGRIEYSDENLIKAFRYFPLVGIVVGGLSASVYLLSMFILPPTVSILIALIVGVLTTGGLHEDGFSDFFDAFGGGHTKQRILEIMKDSTIGVYGVMSLILLFLMKFALLYSLPLYIIPSLLIASGSSARFMSIAMSRISQYARNEGEKSKSMHLKIGIDNFTTFVAALFAFLPLLLLPLWISLIALGLYVITLLSMRHYIEKRIGGYTGDVLGALEQLCEVIIFAVASVYFTLHLG